MLYRVSAFSAWAKPEHHPNLTVDEKDDLVWELRDQQYKVVVTFMDEPEPTSF